MRIILFALPFVAGLMNLYPIIKYRKYWSRDWYQQGLIISLGALAICFVIGIAGIMLWW